MDELLKRQPAECADERKEMFGLIDRFMSAISKYRTQYCSIEQRRDTDIKNRTANKTATLSNLSKAQKAEKDARTTRMENKVRELESRIRSVRDLAAKSLMAEDTAVTNFEQQEAAELSRIRSADDAKLTRYREVRDRLQQQYDNVDALLGKTFSGDSRLKRIIDAAHIKSNVGSLQQALEAVDSKRISKAEKLYADIRTITESLPRKIIFNRKRTEHIVELVGYLYKASSAVKWLEDDSRSRQMEAQKASDERCKERRRQCSSQKLKINTRRDSDVRALEAQIAQEKSACQAELQKLSASHASAYTAQEKHLSRQITDAATMWTSELNKCSQSFDASMEKEFPNVKFNQWMLTFWRHPSELADYSRINGQQLNTLIGEAFVNVKDLFSGSTSRVIDHVMRRYITLFGRTRAIAMESYKKRMFRLPYSISIENGTSLMFAIEPGCEERVRDLLNAICMRKMLTVPPCMMRFRLLDANGVGTFGKLLSLDPAARNNPSEPTVKSLAIGENARIHSLQEDIAEQIADTKGKMDELSQQLANYPSIRLFNQSHPMSTQIYCPIVMMNFPLGLGEKELRTLSVMNEDCSKWGFSMLLAQPDGIVADVKPELQPILKSVTKQILTLRVSRKAQSMRVLNSNSMTEKVSAIQIYGIPDTRKLEQVANDIRVKSVEASRVLINFMDAKDIYPPENTWFKGCADDGIEVPVGYLEGGQPFNLQFDDRHIHTLILGNIRSGKTNLLHVMMTNIMLRYSPDEVQLYLIDFKYGVDFRIYTQFNLPNFRSISINNDPEFALAMLTEFEREQTERSQRLEGRYQKVSEYNRQNPNKRLKRIILVVDELYALTKNATDDVQKAILKKIDTFAHQTGAFGIHMVICGQDLDKIENFETIKNQCTNRLALHCSDEQVKMIMDDAGVARMHTIDVTDQGACVFTLNSGNDPHIEHTAYLSSAHLGQLLRRIHDYYTTAKRFTDVKVLMTKVVDNPNHPVQMFVENGLLPDLPHNRLLVGEPVSMTRSLNLYPRQHIWLVGGQSEDAMNAGNSFMFYSAVSLLLMKLKGQNMELICTDCADSPMRTPDDEENDLFWQLTSHYPQWFRYSSGKRMNDALRFITGELNARRSGTSSSTTPIWWCLMRPELMGDLLNDMKFVIGFKNLLQAEEKYNIHILLWNADLKQARQLQLDRTMFADTVCLEMPGDDIKTVCNMELKPAPVGYKGVHIGQNTMHFRIYDLPDGNWMNKLVGRLNSKNAKH